MTITDRIPGESARMYARRMILNNIIDLELPPGSAVSENELSASLQLSRTPVREALIEMNRMGLVEILPQKGSYIAKIDYKLIEDAKFIRLAIETAVVRLICEQGLPQEFLLKLHENMEEQKQAASAGNSQKQLIKLDNEFHRLLFVSVGKEGAYEFVKSQMVHFDRLRALTLLMLKSEKDMRMLNDHENILYALERKDSELAELLTTQHLSRHQVERHELFSFCPEYFV